LHSCITSEARGREERTNLERGENNQKGVDIDGDFTGYRNIDAASAAGILRYLNDPIYGPKIQIIWVTGSSSGQFANKIRGVKVPAPGGGTRLVSSVILDIPDHGNHFHIRFFPN
jgi:hypothetical protein